VLKPYKLFSSTLRICVFSLFSSVSVFAQDISSFSSNSTSVDQNAEVVFSVQLQKQGPLAWCGLQFNFGNGESRLVRIGDNGDSDLSTNITYQYPNAGTYTASVEGKLIIRGLKSVIPCGGDVQQLVMTVMDAETQRLREKLSRVESDKRELEEKDRKVKEFERQKSLELAQKEEELKKREQDLRKQAEQKKVEIKKVETAKPIERPAEPKKVEPPKPKAKAESIL
jgi:PKD domain